MIAPADHVVIVGGNAFYMRDGELWSAPILSSYAVEWSSTTPVDFGSLDDIDATPAHLAVELLAECA